MMCWLAPASAISGSSYALLNRDVEFRRREPGHGHRLGVFAGLLDVVRGVGDGRGVNTVRRIDQTG
jgi:hypothetical protein